MNNKISNKVVHDKSHSEYIPEETKNTLSNSKNNEIQTINKSILNKNKKPFYNKKQKNVSIGINLEKLIINKRKNNNINNNNQLDQINRNLSYNSIISNKKNINQNNSLSILSKSNKKPEGLKNLKHSTNNFNCNNNNVINKGKTYFIKNLDLTEETLEPSQNSGSKIFNKSIMNNNIPRIYEKQKILQNNSLIIKNNSFANPNTNNNALIPPQRIKNCYTNLNINKNDSNRKKNKLKGIPFSLKKNKPKINTILQNNINNVELNLENSEENIRPIYKNEKLLQKKKNLGNNKAISIKVGNNNKDIFLTEKNNNDNLKKSFCNSDVKKSFFNDVSYKRISPLAKNGIYISPSKQGLEFIDNKSFKIVRKLDLGQNIDEESKKDMDVKYLDENNAKIGKIFNKVSKVKILHDNQKKKVMFKNNKLNNKSTNSITNKNGNNGNNNMNINNEKMDIQNNKINNPKMQKNKSDKNSNSIKKHIENQQKSKIDGKIKIKISVENQKNSLGNNNNIINPITESEKNNEEDEEIDTIEDSLKSSNHIISIHIFKTPNIYLSKTNIISCLKLLPKILNLEKFIRISILFCDLETLNKLCLISKKYYKCIKPIINKIIMEKVYNYNKNNKNKYKNKIKSSLLKFSSLSEISKTLLEKKYKDLLFENNCIYDEQIKKDLTRTLPGNISFQYGNENYNKLYHLLTAYANYNKNIGYAQGLNFLAANTIFIFEKEMDEFLFLDALIQKFNLENIIGLSNNLSIKLEEITNCLNKYFPKIKKYLESMNLNYEFFLAGWVLTLFSNSINNEYLFYIWDFMIIFGWDYFNCFIIAVLKKYENEILSLPQNKLTFYMKNILRNDSFQKDFETIMKSSFEFL
jgi:hypothetical protein